MRKYNAESPKQVSRRFNSIVKTNFIADLGIVYLWCVWCMEDRNVTSCIFYYFLVRRGGGKCLWRCCLPFYPTPSTSWGLMRYFDRAGHATTLPQQRDHVLRSHNWRLLHYVYIFVVATPFIVDTETITFFVIFIKIILQYIRCMVVALSLSRT